MNIVEIIEKKGDSRYISVPEYSCNPTKTVAEYDQGLYQGLKPFLKKEVNELEKKILKLELIIKKDYHFTTDDLMQIGSYLGKESASLEHLRDLPNKMETKHIAYALGLIKNNEQIHNQLKENYR